MLVLGAHGVGAFGSMALGSVSWYAAAHASCPVVIIRRETVDIHQEIGIGIGDLDASADPLTFAFEEASLRKASLIAVHAWHTPLAAISRAGSPSPVPDLAATVAEAGRRLAGLLDDWRKKYRDVPVSQYVVRDRPGRVLVRLVHPRRPGGHRQARKPTRPAWSRLSQACRPEPRIRTRRGGPVVLTWPDRHGKSGKADEETCPQRLPPLGPGTDPDDLTASTCGSGIQPGYDRDLEFQLGQRQPADLHHR